MKFAFPASKAVLDGLLPETEFEIWTNIARLTEMHFYSGRFGWSQEEISNSYKLSARFNYWWKNIKDSTFVLLQTTTCFAYQKIKTLFQY